MRNRSGRPRGTDEACDQRIIVAGNGTTFYFFCLFTRFEFVFLLAILSPFDTAEEIRETAEAINIVIRTLRSPL